MALLQRCNPGEPFFFKLKAPYNAIGGFGLFARFARFAPLPVWRAWDIFGQAHGISDEHELLKRLQRLGGERRVLEGMNRVIGCIAVTDVVMFTPDEWVPTPADWSRNIVSGRTYDLDAGEGGRLWRWCLERAAQRRATVGWVAEALERERTGTPVAGASPIVLDDRERLPRSREVVAGAELIGRPVSV